MARACALPAATPAHGMRELLGAAAWARLPAAVRHRFATEVQAVEYTGSFDIVRASLAGRLMAHLCRLVGTPVVPWTGQHISATVQVMRTSRGVRWSREYRWRHGRRCTVSSTKIIDTRLGLIEALPACLCMALDAYERDGALHFLSHAYFFALPLPFGSQLTIGIPIWLTPGITHVEHRDEGQGWFRFTMHVNHPLFGETYYQTGRFHAAGEAT